ncbi:hypothetical protein POM88_032279 [Heracleum sosnowskyi]|uniref:CASP-like protein n=1 Tax=Heracleum sosnowskyi TaxID=360622 RepID=A0AAD8HZB0_9APIA|nr:hypothetical protein POM88_032279 [Heracleum sosnowskyi]
MNTGEEGKSTEMIAVKVQKYTKAAQIFLRFMAMATTLAASVIVLSSEETVVVFGLTAVAKYSYSPTYKFFAAANLIACSFSAISLLLFYIMGKTLKSINYFFFFLHDVVVMTLLVAGCSAATAMGYLGKYGESVRVFIDGVDYRGETRLAQSGVLWRDKVPHLKVLSFDPRLLQPGLGWGYFCGLGKWSLNLLPAFGCGWLNRKAKTAVSTSPTPSCSSDLNWRCRFGEASQRHLFGHG